MNWTVIVPLKGARTRKTRLAPRLDVEARDALALAMLDHVATVLASQARVVLLAAAPPDGWRHDWTADRGRGLNAELAAAWASRPRPLAVVHADLPLLRETDVVALFAAALSHGLAIAPDRHGTGTNAIAVSDARAMRFAFGAASFETHRRTGAGPAAIVRTTGLAHDVDTASDLDDAVSGSAAYLERALCGSSAA